MTISIQEADFDLGAEMAALRAGDARVGALVSFVGLVRDMNEGSGISEMTLEHYPGMTEKALEAIVAEAGQRWALYATRVIHRMPTGGMPLPPANSSWTT
jgi:molybdopterin synthase catalytic subunit